MTLAGGNLFADLPARLVEERCDELLSTPDLRIERIVSIGHTTPPGAFLEQEWAEWGRPAPGFGHAALRGRGRAATA